ncbi:long-chain fatty acid--CoA ligase [bacterium]|nr:long-chain fatty acid--CoA ligase [bacterium]
MKTLPSIIARFDQRPSELIAIQFKRDRQWIKWSWGEYFANIESCFYLLQESGLKSGDKVAIFSTNSIEWVLVDLAAQCLGVVTVPIYPNCSDEDLQLILSKTSPQLIFIGDESLKLRLGKDWSSRCIDFSPSGPSVTGNSERAVSLSFWDQMNFVSKKGFENFPLDFKSQCSKISIDQLATLVFTSGTSGKPKGIGLTQRQIMSELKDISLAFPITSQDLTLSFLPYAHILGRVEMWLSSYCGFTLAICSRIEKIQKDLVDTSPTVLIAVPRIFEKIYTSVISKLKSSSLNRVIEHFETRGFLGSLSMAPARLLLQKKVKQGLQEALGGRLKYAISGGAPLAKEVALFFKDCDVLLLEGYGLTETTGAISVNTPELHHFGTVGKPLHDVKIKLAEDGEILVKSEKVFAMTLDGEEDRSKDEKGYFRTGDIGEWTPDGFLRITDRKKDLIKTSGGKYVAPQRIENLFKKHPLISHVLVHGDQKKFIVALITLEPEELKSWALSEKIPFSKVSDLAHASKTIHQVEEILREINGELASFESIKKFQILDHDFTVENGELTPSLKLRRKFCEQKYKDQLESLYGI